MSTGNVVEAQIWVDITEASPAFAIDRREFSTPLVLTPFPRIPPLTPHFSPLSQEVGHDLPSVLEACRHSEAVKPAFVFDGRLLVDAAALTQIGFKVTTIGRPSL
ncbi:hypothetical protein B0H11DRAFT_2298832 [Mycena galericulata]|nr:hypothetical protein B0H11DRAFT_2298832 [Mycena galericulata]